MPVRIIRPISTALAVGALLTGCLGGRPKPGAANAKRQAAQSQVDEAMVQCANGKTPETRRIVVTVTLDERGLPLDVNTIAENANNIIEQQLDNCLKARIRQIEFPKPAEAGEKLTFTLNYD